MNLYPYIKIRSIRMFLKRNRKTIKTSIVLFVAFITYILISTNEFKTMEILSKGVNMK